MHHLRNLFSMRKASGAFKTVTTVGAIVGGAVWVYSLNEDAVSNERFTPPEPQTAPATIPKRSELHRPPASPEVTVFVVGSEESAAALRLRFADLAVYHWHFGMEPRHDQVVVVPEHLEAVRLADSLTQESAILAANGLPGFHVMLVDSSAVP